MTGPRRSTGEVVLAGVALVIGSYVLVGTVVMIVQGWNAVPLYDQWENLVTGRALTWRWLVSRPIFVVDYWLAHETNVVNFAASPLLQAGLALLMVRLGRAAGFGTRAQIAWVAGTTLALLFWSAQQENFIWGFQSQFFLVFFATVAAFSVLAIEPPTAKTLALSIVLQGIPVYTMANGVLVPFFSIALAVWLGRRRQLVWLGGAALLLSGSSFIGLTSTDWHLRLREVPARLGGPFGVTLGWLFPVRPLVAAIVCGAVGLAAFAALGVWLLRRRDASAPVKVLFVTGSFTLATSMLAITGGYATPAVLFWLTLFLLGGACLGVRRAMQLTTPALLLVVAGQAHFQAIAAGDAEGRAVAETVIAANVADPDVLTNVHQLDAVTPLRERGRLEAAHTSLFAAPWISWAGSKIADHLQITDAARCTGGFDSAREISDDQHPGWHVSGRAWEAGPDRAPRRILLADKSGTIVGYARGGLAAEHDGRGWVGAMRAADARGVTAYAILRDGRSACPLWAAPRIIGAPQLVLTEALPPGLPAAGFIDSLPSLSDHPAKIRITGWGLLQQDEGTRRVLVETNLPVRSGRMASPPRPDVAAGRGDNRLLHSGIDLTLELDPARPLPAQPRLCVWTEDAVFGRARLQVPSHPEVCAP